MNENRCPVCNGAIVPTDTVCPSCGFKLAGTTQAFMPLESDDGAANAQQSIDAEQAPAAEETHLTVLRGPQVGVAFKLGSEPLIIGRSPNCGIFLNDMTVSREHAKIEPVPGGYKIVDNNSFNGVWINNENVSEAVLKNDDIIQIGAFCLGVSC